MTEVFVSDIFIYPVKSMAGCAVPQSLATPSGLEGDRQWAVFKNDDSALTQRQSPRMSLIQPVISPQGLTLKAPTFGQISVDEPDERQAPESFTIWKDISEGRVADATTNAWVTEFLKSKAPLRLVKAVTTSKRVFHDSNRFSLSAQFFSDAAPYLLCNQGSLSALNQSMEAKSLPPVDIINFRANIVISGLEAFREHDFTKLRLPGSDKGFRLVDHCQRCSVITVNPEKGKFLPNAYPLTSLAVLNTMPKKPKAPAFGVNSTLINHTAFDLHIGQKLRLLS